MKKNSLVFVIAFVSFLGGSVFAGAKGVKDPEELTGKLVAEIKALDPAVVSVRPAYTIEPGRGRFKVQWNPAVKIKKDTPSAKQEEIAKKVANYVVSFQGGVPTDVYGGILAFIEGDGWVPEIGQVAFKIDEANPKKVEVWMDLNIVEEDGNVVCCNEGKVIGHIEGSRFIVSR